LETSEGHLFFTYPNQSDFFFWLLTQQEVLMTTFITGPAASGKSRYAKQIAAHYNCTHIVDEWLHSNEKITPHTLVLTQADLDGAIPIDQALSDAGVTERRFSTL
jgi:nicotinamide riboside kinase